MQIKTLKIKNFMPYKDIELNFTNPLIEEGKHIYLIHGENRYGKTSILRSINWVLYGETNKKAKFDLINEKTSKSGGTVNVTIDFYHDNRFFSLSRSLDVPANMNESINLPDHVNLIMDGKPFQEQSDKTIDDFISSILPKSASQFYFFDGVAIEKYAQDDCEDNVKKSIKTFLGLDLCTTTTDDISNVIKELNNDLALEMSKNEKYRNLKNQITEITAEREELKCKISQDEKEREESKQKKIELSMMVEQYKEAENLQKQINALEQNLTQSYIELEELKTKENGLVSDYYLIILKNQFSQADSNIATKVGELNSKVEPLLKLKGKKEFLHEMLNANQEECFCCGSVINEKERGFIQERLSELEIIDESYDSLISEKIKLNDLDKKMVEAYESAVSAEQTLNNISSQILGKENHINTINKQIKDIKKQQRELGLADVNTLRTMIENEEAKIERLTLRLGSNSSVLNKFEQDLSSKLREVMKLSKSDTLIKSLTLQIKAATSIKKVFDNFTEAVIKYKKDGIQTMTNEIYKKTINAPEGSLNIKINDDYSFSLQTASGDITPLRRESPGGKEVAAFSFIMGLNAYAAHVAPIILDTPTGHLDDTHKLKISQELTKYKRGQVMMFVTSADLKSGVYETLRNSIVQEFEISRDEMNRLSNITERRDNNE